MKDFKKYRIIDARAISTDEKSSKRLNRKFQNVHILTSKGFEKYQEQGKARVVGRVKS